MRCMVYVMERALFVIHFGIIVCVVAAACDTVLIVVTGWTYLWWLTSSMAGAWLVVGVVMIPMWHHRLCGGCLITQVQNVLRRWLGLRPYDGFVRHLVRTYLPWTGIDVVGRTRRLLFTIVPGLAIMRCLLVFWYT